MTDNIKNNLGRALALAALLVGVAAVWYVGVYARSSEPASYRSFSVSGEGKVVGVPDVARFTFSIISEGGKDIAALQKDNVTKTNAVVDFVKQSGVDPKDVSTEGYNVEPRYQTSYCGPVGYGTNSTCSPATIVGYTVSQTVAVKVRDLGKVGDILSGVVAKGANNVSQLNFTVDDPAKLEEQARSKAIAQAQEKAEAIARAGDFRLGRLLSIDEGGPVPYYGKAYGLGGLDAMSERSVAAQAVPAPSIQPGSQDIVVNVMLRYEIR